MAKIGFLFMSFKPVTKRDWNLRHGFNNELTTSIGITLVCRCFVSIVEPDFGV